ncbi:MAG: PTS fructose transporter subunit IIA [Planctomycetota bacterium]|nr:MAG: PTS fructose transporter subunit IIA [Planctomycetota bacterium]
MEPDFDVDQLAAYLHLLPQQVARLADRGGLPGRKVGGEWRFSRAEIHHWLEDRIGISGDEELAAMELRWRRDAGTDDEHPSVSAMLPLEAIAVPFAARTRGSVITSMVELAAQSGLLWDPEKMTEAVRAREEMASTALDNGMALLHPRRPMPSILAEPFLALGITTQGIPFGSGRSGLTDVFFLVCSTSDRGHLRTLARLSRIIGSPGCLDELRSAAEPAAAYEVIARREASISETET